MNCKNLEEKWLIKILFKGTTEKSLSVKEEHLGYEKSDKKGNNSGNIWNGCNVKRIESELRVPRNRNGEFEPKITATTT